MASSDYGDISENDSENSIDFDEEEETNNVEVFSAISGYDYEPRRQSRAPERVPEDDRTRRLGNTNWCTCGHCQAMPTTVESVCCREIKQTLLTAQEEEGYSCITLHPGFRQGCVNKYTLKIAYMQYQQQYGAVPDIDGLNQASRYRYVAYRQLVRWCWGVLGKTHRVPLPSCAVCEIRNEYPTVGGSNTGFKWQTLPK